VQGVKVQAIKGVIKTLSATGFSFHFAQVFHLGG